MKETKKMAPEQQQQQTQKSEGNERMSVAYNSETLPTLEQTITQTIKKQNPEIDLMDSNKVKEAFVKYHLETCDTLSLVEKLFERFILELNGNAEVAQIINQQKKAFASPESKSPKESNDKILKFVSNKNLKGENNTRFYNTLTALKRIFSSDDIEPQALELILKIIDTENYVTESFKKGIIEGRNQKIEEHISQSLSIDGLYNNSASIKPSNNEDGYIERLMRN